MLAKALAHYFEAKLLLLDATDFCLKLQSKHGGGNDSQDLKSFSEAALERIGGLFESFSILPTGAEQRNCKSAGSLWRSNSGIEPKLTSSEGTSNLQICRSNSASEPDFSRYGSSVMNTNNQGSSLKRANSWSFDDKLLVRSLYKVLVSVSKTSPVILYLRDIERLLFRGPKTYQMFFNMIKRLSGPILILGSRILGSQEKPCYGDTEKKLSDLFPYTIDTKPPEDNTQQGAWKSKLEEDMKAIEFQDNRNHVSEPHLLAVSLGENVVTFTNIGVHLTYEKVVRATGNFNVGNLIGNGGFGSTYKAELIPPGLLLAVKRLSVGRFQGIQQFDAEIITLGSIRHQNLVTLIGYYASETEMFLIYNYLPGGNLESFIHERSNRNVHWRVVHKIALDIAQALTYLHDCCVPRVLHRDIKPSNILLDNNLNAYLSDFGLARLLEVSETHATTDVHGTFGYVAPEYAATCRVSDKADVYSYGVVFLELLSARSLWIHHSLPMGMGSILFLWHACWLEKTEDMRFSSLAYGTQGLMTI